MYVFIQLLNSLGLLFEIHHSVNISSLNTVDISVLNVKLRWIQSLVHLLFSLTAFSGTSVQVGEDDCNSLSYYQAFKNCSYTCSSLINFTCHKTELFPGPRLSTCTKGIISVLTCIHKVHWFLTAYQYLKCLSVAHCLTACLSRVNQL